MADERTDRSRRLGEGEQPPLLLRRNLLIAMIQPAGDRHGDQLGRPGDGNIGLRLGNRRVAAKALVRPGNVGVVLKELPHRNCATDWAAEAPAFVCAAWLGHGEHVEREHCLQVLQHYHEQFLSPRPEPTASRK